MKAGLIIAVDGPSGAGKSSSSRALAERLGYRYVDTGALYRVIGLLAWEQRLNPNDGERLAALCEHLPLRFVPEGTGVRVLLGERDITAAIRQPEVSQVASKVSAQPAVRQGLLTLQRNMGKGGGVVMEGRDIGTVVFPKAELKIFLTADNAVRVERRFKELFEKNPNVTIEEIKANLEMRDYIDSNREESPLRKADDAILVDNTNLTAKETIQKVEKLAKRIITS